MIRLEAGDSPAYRWTVGAIGAAFVVGAVALAVRAHRLGWPSGSWKVVLVLAALGASLVVQAVRAPRRVGPGRRR